MARKKSVPSGSPSKKTYDFSKYMLNDSPNAEWAKTKHELHPEQVPDLELSSNDMFPSTMSNNELILPNTKEEMTDDDGNKAGNSSEQAISNIFARVARDAWPFEGEDPNYCSGSKFRNEIETKDMVPWWAVEESDLKSDKNNKSPRPSKSAHSNEIIPENGDPWIPLSVEEIPSFADFEKDNDEVKKTSAHFEYLNDNNDHYQLYNMDTGRIVDLDHNGHEVFIGIVNIIGRYEMKQYPGMIQRLCNDIDKGLVEIQYFGGWQNRIPVEKSTGRLILRSDHALVTISKTVAPSLSKVYPEFGISKQDVRSYPTPTPCLKSKLMSAYASVPPRMARLPIDFTSINSQPVQVIGDPLESPRYYPAPVSMDFNSTIDSQSAQVSASPRESPRYHPTSFTSITSPSVQVPSEPDPPLLETPRSSTPDTIRIFTPTPPSSPMPRRVRSRTVSRKRSWKQKRESIFDCECEIVKKARVLDFEFHTRDGTIPWKPCKRIQCEKCEKTFSNRLDLMKHEYLYSVWKNT